MDSEERKENLDILTESLGLEKIGMILASTTQDDSLFTEAQVRVISKMQEKLSVTHSTGYRLSNFFTVLVRQNKDKNTPLEPQVFMISDQGQALENANLFTNNRSSPHKMKLRSETQYGEVKPTVYDGGKIL